MKRNIYCSFFCVCEWVGGEWEDEQNKIKTIEQMGNDANVCSTDAASTFAIAFACNCHLCFVFLILSFHLRNLFNRSSAIALNFSLFYWTLFLEFKWMSVCCVVECLLFSSSLSCFFMDATTYCSVHICGSSKSLSFSFRSFPIWHCWIFVKQANHLFLTVHLRLFHTTSLFSKNHP